jgi:DNA-binding protein YbaB
MSRSGESRGQESGGPRGPQGGGELSGLLRHAETLQRDLERALVDLEKDVIEAQDAARRVTLRLGGDGSVKSVSIQGGTLSDPERRTLEDAIAVAVRLGLERMFELRKKRATAVTKGLSLPGLFT